jgi:hypothetical protein
VLADLRTRADDDLPAWAARWNSRRVSRHRSGGPALSALNDAEAKKARDGDAEGAKKR